MAWIDRWLYKQSIIWQRRLERFDAVWCGLFVSNIRQGGRPKWQILELKRLLSEHMEQDVFATYEQNNFVIAIRTDMAVIAHITYRARNVALAKSTYIQVELNPRDAHRKALFQAAFIGQRIEFSELVLELTPEMREPRGR
jgi:hypothetical protein